MLVFLLLFCPGEDSEDDHKTAMEDRRDRTGLEDDIGLRLKAFLGNYPGLEDNGLIDN